MKQTLLVLNDIFAEAGVTKDITHQEARRRIDPFGEKIIQTSFQNHVLDDVVTAQRVIDVSEAGGADHDGRGRR